MIRISRFLNEVAAVCSREYLTASQKIRLLCAYYALKMRHSVFDTHPTRVRWQGYTITTPSFSNFAAIAREVFLFGDYYFKADNDTPMIIDCGGNIGMTTLFLKKLYPRATIRVFEPSPTAVQALRKNITQNHLTDVEIVEAAVSDTEGTISFWEQPSKSGGSTAMHSVVESKSGAAHFEEVRVRAVKLSTYVKEDVDLLKLDVEGAEGMIIQELHENGALSRIKSIIMEFHENETNKQNDLSTMIATLKRAGFTIVIFASEITPSSEVMAKKVAHHFLLRASRL